MSTTYKTIAGDTFSSIARQAYGDEKRSGSIVSSNPAIKEPLQAGTVLTIPKLHDRIQDDITDNSAPSGVEVYIDGKKVSVWATVSLSIAIDKIAMLSLTVPFDHKNEEFKALYKPFTFKECIVKIEGGVKFKGTIINISPTVTAKNRDLNITAYAKCRVLNDCDVPASNLDKKSFRDTYIKTIASELSEIYGIKTVFAEGVESSDKIKYVAIEAQESILRFLTDVAKQSGLLITSNENGDLYFHKESEKVQAVAYFEQGEAPLLKVNSTFSGQNYYSDVSIIRSSVIISGGGTVKTATNPFLTDVFRSKTYRRPDVKVGSEEAAAKNQLGKMFANAASYEIVISTWHDSNGDLFKPNTFIDLKAPDAMVYEKYTFLVRTVILERTEKGQIAILRLALPGTYNNNMGSELPWAS